MNSRKDREMKQLRHEMTTDEQENKQKRIHKTCSTVSRLDLSRVAAHTSVCQSRDDVAERTE